MPDATVRTKLLFTYESIFKKYSLSPTYVQKKELNILLNRWWSMNLGGIIVLLLFILAVITAGQVN